MLLPSSLGKHIEKTTGLSISQIQDYSPEDFREHLEKKNGKPFSFVSVFPYIGRGNVLRDDLITSQQLNNEIDTILEKE